MHCSYLHQSARAAKAKYHRLGGCNNRRLFYPCSGSWKPEIRVAAWSGSGEDSLPDLQMAGHLGAPSQSGKGALWRCSSSKDPTLWVRTPRLMTSYNLSTSHEGPISKYSCWLGVELRHMNLGGGDKHEVHKHHLKFPQQSQHPKSGDNQALGNMKLPILKYSCQNG